MDLRTVIRARAPGRLSESQAASVELNGAPVTTMHLPEEWTDLHLVLPARAMVPERT